MSQLNWCSAHETVWFKKGNMRGYAHPVKDENGNDVPGQWCNRPKDWVKEPALVTEAKKLGAVEDIMTKDDWADKDTRTRKSIERQTSLNDATLIAVAKIEKGAEMTTDKVIEVSKRFEKYLDTGE